MIKGKRVLLRSFELSDLDEVVRHWNSMELRNLVGAADSGPASRNDEEEFIKGTWKRRQERKAFTLAIETIAEGRLIGGISLMNINWTNRSAMLGISIFIELSLKRLTSMNEHKSAIRRLASERLGQREKPVS